MVCTTIWVVFSLLAPNVPLVRTFESGIDVPAKSRRPIAPQITRDFLFDGNLIPRRQALAACVTPALSATAQIAANKRNDFMIGHSSDEAGAIEAD
jgi:hypothetical protein